MLSEKLKDCGCKVHQVGGDVDLPIVKMVIASAAGQDAHIIGDNINLLKLTLIKYLLLIFFWSEVKKNAGKPGRY